MGQKSIGMLEFVYYILPSERVCRISTAVTG